MKYRLYRFVKLSSFWSVYIIFIATITADIYFEAHVAELIRQQKILNSPDGA